MKQVVCAVYDSKLGAYSRPMFVPSKGVAIRSFQDEIRREERDNVMFNHPDDFSLHCLAFFEDDTGVFDQSGGVEVLVSGSVAR